MPSGLDGVDGDEIALSAKPALFDFSKDDAYECGPQAGGGWGDPIEREPERVAEDVRVNAVSERAARNIYGVVVNADGALDETATKARRDASAPTAELAADEAHDHGRRRGDGEVVAPIGDRANFVRIAGKIYLRCDCGSVIAPAGENWKHFACQGVATADELGPRIAMHEDLVATRYACPSCARLLESTSGSRPTNRFSM